jgi:hypothetical protein
MIVVIVFHIPCPMMILSGLAFVEAFRQYPANSGLVSLSWSDGCFHNGRIVGLNSRAGRLSLFRFTHCRIVGSESPPQHGLIPPFPAFGSLSSHFLSPFSLPFFFRLFRGIFLRPPFPLPDSIFVFLLFQGEVIVAVRSILFITVCMIVVSNFLCDLRSLQFVGRVNSPQIILVGGSGFEIGDNSMRFLKKYVMAAGSYRLH